MLGMSMMSMKPLFPAQKAEWRLPRRVANGCGHGAVLLHMGKTRKVTKRALVV